MRVATLFDRSVRVRIQAPTSRYDRHEGTVDAHELRAAQCSRARKHPPALTIHFDDGCSTIAYADELVLADPWGTRTDNEDSHSPEAQE
jgi:hypothetical protein